MTLTRGALNASALVSLVLNMATASSLDAGELPEVRFDVPRRAIAIEVAETDPHAPPVAGRLVEITVPISMRLVRGDVHRVREVAIEIDAGGTGLVVHDFAPQTTLGSELAGDIQVTTTKESGRTFDATLGGQSPIPIGEVVAHITPSISTGSKNREVETETTARLAPKRPVAVSGTLNGGQGAFFQLRPSSQTTLEGQHQLSIVFRAPLDWRASELVVRCWARGERKVLWFDQLQVWGSAQSTVRIATRVGEPAPHVVAKQPVEEVKGEWVAVEVAAPE